MIGQMQVLDLPDLAAPACWSTKPELLEKRPGSTRC
jgi:hypothetical protein